MRILTKRIIPLTLCLVMMALLCYIPTYALEEDLLNDYDNEGICCYEIGADMDMCATELAPTVDEADFVGIEPSNWPWTDCSNVLGHSWGGMDNNCYNL